MTRLFRTLCAVALATTTALAASASDTRTFRWSYQGDVNSLDPMALSEAFTLSFQYAFYEPLVARDDKLNLIPALATRWENPEPTKWIFHLRKNVEFHDGSPFTADDVIFSWERSLTPGSNMQRYGALASSVTKIDAHTVEVTTPRPNPILPENWTFLYMMSKSWAEKHDATEAAKVADNTGYATMHENGTGPFVVTERQPDVRTTLTRFDAYWDKNIRTNVTDIVFQPIKQDSTRISALISGDMDLIQAVPLQDWERVDKTQGISLLRKPETRAIFIGFDQFRDELLYSSVKGKNPFKDKRVRQAITLAVDTNLINQKIMRDQSRPLGTIIAASVNGYDDAFGKPYTPDLDRARQLMAEAGYADGFEVTLDCPNDRYVNDEQMCQAVASMLTQIGIKIDLQAQTKSKYFAKVGPSGDYQTSMYMLGWAPGTVDAEDPLINLVACRDADKALGVSNYGNYCNPEIDGLTAKISVETDHDQRNALIKKAFSMLRDDYGYLPLLQPPLSWGLRDGIQVQQRADGFLDMRQVVLP